MSGPFDLSVAVEATCVDALRQAATALDLDDHAELDVGIHTARKRIKRVRAVIRLVRNEVPAAVYSAENAWLRDSGRRFAELRDAKIMIETLAVLRTAAQNTSLDTAEFTEAELALSTRYARAKESTTREVVREARERLLASASRLEGFPGSATVLTGFELIESGLRTSYKKGRRRLRRAMASRSTEDLHEWRKVVKHLRYQLELLSPGPNGVFSDLIRDLDALGELLGTDHDIAVTVDSMRDLVGTDELSVLGVAADSLRGSLQEQAFGTGAACYRSKPSDFVDRVRDYWSATDPDTAAPIRP